MNRNGSAPLGRTRPRLDEEIRGRLAETPFEIVGLETEVDGHHVVLRGRVHSWYAKQLAQVLVMPIDGIETLSNELEVAPLV